MHGAAFAARCARCTRRSMNCATGAGPQARSPVARRRRAKGERRRRGTCCRHTQRERESRDGEAPERAESGQSSRPWGNTARRTAVPSCVPCAVLCGVGSSGVGYVSERQCIVHASCLPETIYDDTIIYMRIDMTGDSMASIDIPIPPLNAASLVPMIAKLHDALTQVVGLGGYSP